MTYDECIQKLRFLIENTEPADKTTAQQNVAAASSLIDWATRHSASAAAEFKVVLSYFSRFALYEAEPGDDVITKQLCIMELDKLPCHLPPDE